MMETLPPLKIPQTPSVPLTLPIACYRWVGNTGPKAWGELFYDSEAIHVKLCAYEWPLSVRSWEDGGEVWEDSCLELFIRPDQDERYMNIEINPLGAMIIGLGRGREDREDLLELKPRLRPCVTVEPCEGRWSVSFYLPFMVLWEMYGQPAGPLFWANLFKCGGLTENYGMWRGVRSPQPDFHRPEYFGALVLDKP
jgi:hypothetical protein